MSLFLDMASENACALSKIRHVQLGEGLVPMWVKDEDLRFTRSQLKL